MKQELELYIHIPFCVRKCNYCDFLSFPAGVDVQNAYVTQLINELTFHAASCGDYTVSSVFIGGGTPSILPENRIADIVNAIHTLFYVRPDAEMTIECNPSSVMRHKFSVYREAGLNRISMGLQSADNAELRMLGRVHTFEEFLKAYQSARMEGFSNVNIDLINCFPMQSVKTWKKTLKNVLMLKPEHVSVYNLIVEEGTPFYEMREQGLLMMPSEEEQEGIDAYTKEAMSKYGYQRYEFSNYAKPDRECRHNIGYWRGTPYLGLGLGASSFMNHTRWKNTSSMQAYMNLDFLADRAAAESVLKTEVNLLSREDRMAEFVYLGMRMVSGISATEFRANFGRHFENVFGEPLEKNIALGLIEQDGDRYRLSERGIDVSNVVLSEFLL